jgi:hypothetical protein
MTDKEKKIIKDYIDGNKLLYKKLEELYEKYKDKNSKLCPYIDFLTMYMSDKTPNLNDYMKAKRGIKNS